MSDDIYREIILDHYRNPRNKGKMSEADVSIHDSNPLCGDEIAFQNPAQPSTDDSTTTAASGMRTMRLRYAVASARGVAAMAVGEQPLRRRRVRCCRRGAGSKRERTPARR